MGHEEHGPLEPTQGLHEHLLGVEVQVVGGLVEHQEVRGIEQHLAQDQAALLAAGEHADRLVDLVPGEVEGAEGVALARGRRGREGGVQLLVHRPVRIEDVERGLGEVAELEARPELHVALVGLEGARHQLEQGALAGAVDPHHAPALAALDLEVEPVVHDVLAVGLPDAAEGRHVVPRARGLLHQEGHQHAPLGRLELVDLLELLDPALDLGRLGRVLLEALDEALLLLEHRLLAREGRLLVRGARGLLVLVVVVVTRVAHELAGVDRHDAAHHAVHEVPVVAGHQDRRVRALEEALQPEDRLDVEVVRGLVEQQDVGLGEQDLRDLDPHPPAAGQLPDVPIHAPLVEAEPRQDLARPGIELVAAELLELLLHGAEALEQALHGVELLRVAHVALQRRELRVQRAHAPAARDGLLQHRAAAHLGRVLTEVTDGQLARDRDLPLVGGLLAQDQPEEGRLPGPVGPDEADPLARIELERGLQEQGLAAEVLGDSVEGDHGAGRIGTGACRGNPLGRRGANASALRNRANRFA